MTHRKFAAEALGTAVLVIVGVGVARFVVAGLPKTRSGKILRGTMRWIADGENYPVPATILRHGRSAGIAGFRPACRS